MPRTLLPSQNGSRTSPPITLSNSSTTWLESKLKEIHEDPRTRSLNNLAKQRNFLTEILSKPTAVWTLCSLHLPKKPGLEFQKHEDPLVEAQTNYYWLHIEAWVVHVWHNEISFRLTSDVIRSLVNHHKDVFSLDESAAHHMWDGKEGQLDKLQNGFRQAANAFVFSTQINVLKELQKDGSGELPESITKVVEGKILAMFSPLKPPQLVHPQLILPKPGQPD